MTFQPHLPLIIDMQPSLRKPFEAEEWLGKASGRHPAPRRRHRRCQQHIAAGAERKTA